MHVIQANACTSCHTYKLIVFYEPCLRQSMPNQIILWVHGSETLMSWSVQNASSAASEEDKMTDGQWKKEGLSSVVTRFGLCQRSDTPNACCDAWLF